MGTRVPVKQREERAVETTRPWRMFEEMERWADEVFTTDWLRPFHYRRPFMLAETWPRVDVVDHDDSIEVRAALPGYAKDEVEVTLTDHTVTVEGHKKSEEKEEEAQYYRHEIRAEDFVRTVTLPEDVDEMKAEATFREGILELTAPKQAPAKRRTLEIH